MGAELIPSSEFAQDGAWHLQQSLDELPESEISMGYQE
jgi:hypothetical protein